MPWLDGRKKIFSCVARMISLQFHSRKIPSLGGLRTDLRCFSLPLSPPSSLFERYQLSTLSTPSTTANVRLCLVCILLDFPLLGVNGFLFGVVRFGVHQETPLCPGVSDTTLGSEVTVDQRLFGAPRRNFVRSWS